MLPPSTCSAVSTRQGYTGGFQNGHQALLRRGCWSKSGSLHATPTPRSAVPVAGRSSYRGGEDWLHDQNGSCGSATRDGHATHTDGMCGMIKCTTAAYVPSVGRITLETPWLAASCSEIGLQHLISAGQPAWLWCCSAEAVLGRAAPPSLRKSQVCPAALPLSISLSQKLSVLQGGVLMSQ